MVNITSLIIQLGSAFVILITIVSILLFAFWIWMLIDAITKQFKNKIIWIILIIFLSVIGALLYLLIARPKVQQVTAVTGQANATIPKQNNSQKVVPGMPPKPKMAGTAGAEQPLFKIEQLSILSLPETKDPRLINIKYPLIPPYAYAHIHWDTANTELVYEIKEPELTDKEKEVLETLEDGIRELINLSFISTNDRDTILIYLEKNIRVLLTELSIQLSMESYLKIMYYIYRDFVGLNELEPMMNDYFIEDVECNGLNTPVYIVHRKYRNIRTSLIYNDINKMAAFVEKLAQKCGRYVSYAEPVLDGSLPDGSRVNATYTKDITTRGPTYSIRKFTREPWSPIQLMIKGTCSAEILAYIWMMTEYENSYMVIGGTGTGKTSFLNVCAFFIPPQARIVSIEDTRELQIEHENWLPSVARAGVGITNILGQRYGEVNLFDLLRASFRQRPDYIIVGEVRGKEAFVLFQSFSSGHPGMATMHAEDVSTLIKRLETEPINLSGSLIETLAAVVVMAQSRIKGKEVRKVISIDEIVEIKEGLGGEVLNNVFRWDPKKDVFNFNLNSKVFENISVHFGFTKEQVLNEYNLRTKLIKELYKKGIVGFKEVQHIIHEYYKSPEVVLRRLNLI